ncbi:AzlD family protein [Pseudomonas sp. MAFF212428]|uniref:AzlD family protein n=1 Tax=Pseudomonas brassicae TaxID=2708063 RepID=A0A6B3NRI8_9PSED|nr:AzlD family protein [Pseudomonas brassicae]NER59587.1 AzlD family protein [Pseudomonas brassicae]NER63711.1 AzlD family protein [Pseudomonas brassicae]
MIGWASLLTFVGMGAVTYATRVLGFLLLRNRHLSPRARAVMQSAPGCVLISVIAPYFVSSQPEQLAALAITVAAASRLSMLPTVVIAVASLGVLKAIMG